MRDISLKKLLLSIKYRYRHNLIGFVTLADLIINNTNCILSIEQKKHIHC